MKKVADTKPANKSASRTPKPANPVLFSGGNRQISKGDGDGPLQAYMAAMPGWTSAIGKRLASRVSREVTGVARQ